MRVPDVMGDKPYETSTSKQRRMCDEEENGRQHDDDDDEDECAVLQRDDAAGERERRRAASVHPLALLDRQAEIRVGALERLHPSRRCHLSYRAIAAISISSHQHMYALVCNARGVNISSTDRDNSYTIFACFAPCRTPNAHFWP